MTTSLLFGQTSGTFTAWKKKRAKKLPPQKKYEYRKKMIQTAQRSSGPPGTRGPVGHASLKEWKKAKIGKGHPREPYVWMEPGYKPGKHPHKHKHHR